jgi:hypothetical protein
MIFVLHLSIPVGINPMETNEALIMHGRTIGQMKSKAISEKIALSQTLSILTKSVKKNINVYDIK